MPDGQTLARKPEKRKTLAEWEKEFAGGSKTNPMELLLTEEQARGAIQRRALVQNLKTVANFINSKRKKRPPSPPGNVVYLPEQPVYRVRP